MTRLIVCNDGTWNNADQEDNGVPAPTNVFKLHNALADRGDDGVEQRKYYHPGVGADGGWLNALAGGAVGVGISNHIRSAYWWLATNYRPGDEIFIYGFSRGAFTARSLGGLIGRGLLDLRGLPSKEAWKRVGRAYDAYRERTPPARASWAADWAFFHEGATPIRFIGVWDTVGSLGVPDDLEVLNFFDDEDRWQFHDTKLGAHVQTARHAMAIDEIRACFTVTRWSNSADPGRDIKEVWFPGVHSDVGGGYSATDLSDGALLWMIAESQAAGLRFRASGVQTIKPANALGVMHNSYKGAFEKLRSRPRNVDALIPTNQALFHPSAFERQAASPVCYPAYRPTRLLAVGESHSVDVFADTQWNDTGIYLPSGQGFTFSAVGEWLDSRDACDWRGTQNDEFTRGDVVRATSSFLGSLEDVVKKITRNSATDFLGTKRVESFPWFILTGAIANDSGPGAVVPNDGSPSPHQYIKLPDHEHSPFVVANPGYLYCFPNDVWSLYDNNHGSIRLTVTRVS